MKEVLKETAVQKEAMAISKDAPQQQALPQLGGHGLGDRLDAGRAHHITRVVAQRRLQSVLGGHAPEDVAGADEEDGPGRLAVFHEPKDGPIAAGGQGRVVQKSNLTAADKQSVWAKQTPVCFIHLLDALCSILIPA